METPLLEERSSATLCRRSLIESKKLWHLAGPAIFTAICNYSLGALTMTFTGQVGELELAAVSIENSVVAGFGFGFLVRNGSPRYQNNEDFLFPSVSCYAPNM